MVLINDNWEEIRDLEDISKIIREYFNEDLADEMDKMIPQYTSIEYYDLLELQRDQDDCITLLEDENDTLKKRIKILEEKIEELEEKLDKYEPITPIKRLTCNKCGSIFEFDKSECDVTGQMDVMHDGLGSYNIKCPVCRNRQYFNW